MKEFNDDLLQEYLDGTLDDNTRQAVEAYLASSPAARAQLAELEVLFSSLDALPELPLTRDLSAVVVGAIGQETAVLLIAAGLVPLLGWFILTPVLLLISLGAAIITLARRVQKTQTEFGAMPD